MSTVKVEVEPWVILYAARYGIGRFTGAHNDALELIREHWDVLKEWERTIVNDLEHSVHEAHLGYRPESERQAIRDLIAWIEAQP